MSSERAYKHHIYTIANVLNAEDTHTTPIQQSTCSTNMFIIYDNTIVNLIQHMKKTKFDLKKKNEQFSGKVCQSLHIQTL